MTPVLGYQGDLKRTHAIHVKSNYLTALLLVLVLLIQGAAAVAATLPCTPEQMTTAGNTEMSHEAHHGNHHPDGHELQTITNEHSTCCEQMNSDFCTAGGCAASSSGVIAVPSSVLRPAADLTAPIASIQRSNRYSAPPTGIFRPPIA